MVQYLSDEWLQRADEALSQDEQLAQATTDVDLLIKYEVSGAPGGKRVYGLRFENGSVRVEPGPQPDAPITFALDYESAAAIARGELSAQAAFMQGNLKLEGDATVLIRQHALFEALGDALGELRAETEF